MFYWSCFKATLLIYVYEMCTRKYSLKRKSTDKTSLNKAVTVFIELTDLLLCLECKWFPVIFLLSEMSSAFNLDFEVSGIHGYVMMDGVMPALTEITCTFWMKSSDTTNYGTPVSYAVEGSDNAFLLIDYNGSVIQIQCLISYSKCALSILLPVFFIQSSLTIFPSFCCSPSFIGGCCMWTVRSESLTVLQWTRVCGTTLGCPGGAGMATGESTSMGSPQTEAKACQSAPLSQV